MSPGNRWISEARNNGIKDMGHCSKEMIMGTLRKKMSRRNNTEGLKFIANKRPPNI